MTTVNTVPISILTDQTAARISVYRREKSKSLQLFVEVIKSFRSLVASTYKFARSLISRRKGKRVSPGFREFAPGHASVLSSGRRSQIFRYSKGVGIWPGPCAPTFLRLEERMVLETFYVLCELCSCPLPTPPQLNIQISRRDSLSSSLPLQPRRRPSLPRCRALLSAPLRARPRNEKKDVGLAKYYHNDVRL